MDYLKTEGFCFIGFSHVMRHGWISVMYLQVNSEQLVIFTKKKKTTIFSDAKTMCLKAVVSFFYFIIFCRGKWRWVYFFMSLSDYLPHHEQTGRNFKYVMCFFVSLPGEKKMFPSVKPLPDLFFLNSL